MPTCPKCGEYVRRKKHPRALVVALRAIAHPKSTADYKTKAKACEMLGMIEEIWRGVTVGPGRPRKVYLDNSSDNIPTDTSLPTLSLDAYDEDPEIAALLKKTQLSEPPIESDDHSH